jgi:maltooligosyltrehalose trehalohydrolase
MTRFKVWAPCADSVELVVEGHRRPMERSADGWWVADDEVGAGADYAFAVDGADPVPDPRSPWQPHGVGCLSRLLDHSAFPWTDAGWRPPALRDAVLYELHVGTFSPEGTFEGAAARLGHLAELGVTHVEIMPVAQFPGDHGWGYDGVSLYAPQSSYGGPDGLKRLVDACHARGLAVVLDVVYNHFGPTGNHLARFGPYFTERYQTPWGAAVNLDDAGSDEARRFFIDNAKMWLRDYHLDGLRLDAVHALFDQSAVPFLEELAAEVRTLGSELGRELVLIAESDLNDPRVVRGPEAGGYGLGAQWSDDFHHALHAALTGERDGYYADFGPLGDVAASLQRVFVYDGRYSRHRARRHGRPVDALPRDRFLGYLQNHDQVGNRARGERSSHLMGTEALQAAAALVLLGPFVPMLFQGEEWGARTPFLYFTDHRDPTVAEAVRAGRRREFASFGWDERTVPDPQDRATFERSKLDWDELTRDPHRSLLDWHRTLIGWRQSQPALRDPDPGSTRVRFHEEGRWLAMDRGPFTVVASFATGRTRIPLGPRPGGHVLAASGPASLADRSLEMAPGAALIG